MMPGLSPELQCFYCLHKSDYDFPGFYETKFPKANTVEFVQKHLVSFHHFPPNFNSQQTKYLIDLMLCFYTSSEDFPNFLFTFFGKSPPIISEKLKSSKFYEKQLLSCLVFYSTKDSADTDPLIPSNICPPELDKMLNKVPPEEILYHDIFREYFTFPFMWMNHEIRYQHINSMD